jgi:hypothetical protein
MCLLFPFTQTNLIFLFLLAVLFLYPPDTVVCLCCSEISFGPEEMREVALNNAHQPVVGLSVPLSQETCYHLV